MTGGVEFVILRTVGIDKPVSFDSSSLVVRKAPIFASNLVCSLLVISSINVKHSFLFDNYLELFLWCNGTLVVSRIQYKEPPFLQKILV